MKPKYITIDNIHQFLPSELVRSFAWDVKQAAKTKKEMLLSQFSYILANEQGCLPCLGGIACYNMGIIDVSMYDDGDIEYEVARLGDSIRMGMGRYVIKSLKKIYPDTDFSQTWLRDMTSFSIFDIEPFFPSGYKGKELINQIHQYADELELKGF